MNTEKKPRDTKQLRVVRETLRSTDTHPSANELFVEVRKQLPQISLATVYRNLTKLEELGCVQSLEPFGGQKRFDGNSEPHLHIRCLKCDKVTDADTTFSPRHFLEKLSSMVNVKNFTLESYSLELFGTCSECLAF